MLKLVSLLLGFLEICLIADATSVQPYLLYDYNCTDGGNYTPDSNYEYILYNLLGSFTLQASKTQFSNSTLEQAPDRIYGLYLCRGDVFGANCSYCVSAAKDTILKNCPYRLDAIIWFDECLLRYSQDPFFGKLSELPGLIFWNAKNITTNTTEFENIVGRTMTGLVSEVEALGDGSSLSSGMKYATKVVNMTQSMPLYAMEQCTNDLTKSDCAVCLRDAIQQLTVYSRGSRVCFPSCLVRFEVYPFFRLSTNVSSTAVETHINGSLSLHPHPHPHPHPHQRRHLLLISISIAVSSACLGILSIIVIWIYKNKMNAAKTSLILGEMHDATTFESLQFDWNTVKVATRNFCMENKLGEGGFGEVYKGILENGQEVAMKRLSKSSGQGIQEFNTEIVVVAKLQHNNLVKLLGFCLAPKEKILVYEYLQNSSLDRFIFDEDKRLSMPWELRFKIIAGVARGLLYLHEDSRLKIVHRDLKPSNILLDEGMSPKIADFGLAKLFGVDQTQGDTNKIVGTYGYMAPEYAMTGHFSVKSDVYSFGVIVLEIVSGQRNRFFNRPQREEALLHRAWRLWNEGLPLNLVDTLLGDNYPREEVTKCIHMSLLCIQDNAKERPGMASVVAALNGQSVSLPMPKAPTFFGDWRTTVTEVHYNQHAENVEDIVYYQGEAIRTDCPPPHSGTHGITDLYPR